MQIDPTRLSSLSPASITPAAATPLEANQAAATQPAAAAGQTDHIVLSPQASEIQAAHEALAQTPEVRTELVARLKAEVAAGTYQVNPESIADKLLSG